jgi:biotin operon repressor
MTGYTRWDVERVAAASELPRTPKMVLLAMCRLADNSGRVGMSRRKLGRQLGLSPTTVWYAIRSLVDRGWLLPTDQTRDLARLYQLNIPVRSQ